MTENLGGSETGNWHKTTAEITTHHNFILNTLVRFLICIKIHELCPNFLFHLFKKTLLSQVKMPWFYSRFSVISWFTDAYQKVYRMGESREHFRGHSIFRTQRFLAIKLTAAT